MATSSIFKNFVLDAEASKKFCELLLESEKNPEPLNEVNVEMMSKERIKEWIDEIQKRKQI